MSTNEQKPSSAPVDKSSRSSLVVLSDEQTDENAPSFKENVIAFVKFTLPYLKTAWKWTCIVVVALVAAGVALSKAAYLWVKPRVVALWRNWMSKQIKTKTGLAVDTGLVTLDDQKDHDVFSSDLISPSSVFLLEESSVREDAPFLLLKEVSSGQSKTEGRWRPIKILATLGISLLVLVSCFTAYGVAKMFFGNRNSGQTEMVVLIEDNLHQQALRKIEIEKAEQIAAVEVAEKTAKAQRDAQIAAADAAEKAAKAQRDAQIADQRLRQEREATRQAQQKTQQEEWNTVGVAVGVLGTVLYVASWFFGGGG